MTSLTILTTSLNDRKKEHALIEQAEQASHLNNPVALYLLSLRSDYGREAMLRNIKSVATLWGFASFEDIDWSEIRHTHVQLLINTARKEGRSPNSVNTYLAAIKGIARQAWLIKQLDTESYQRIKDVRSQSGRRKSAGRALTNAEINALFASCDNDENKAMGARDAAIISLMVGCGFRRNEMVHINMGDVDRESVSVTVLGKGDKERENAIPSRLAPRVKHWLLIRDGFSHSDYDPLFIRIRRHETLTNDRLNPQSISHVLEKRGVNQALARFTPHDLRRTFATALFDSGQDIRTVQLALGHENIETTKIYDKRGEKRAEKAIRDLDFSWVGGIN